MNHRPTPQSSERPKPVGTISSETRQRLNQLYALLPTSLLPGEDIKLALIRRANSPWATAITGPVSAPAKFTPLAEGGILGGAILDDERIDAELAADRKRDREYDERHQSLQRMLRSVDECLSLSPFLNQKLLEHATAKMSPAIEATFQKYKQFCETWGLPFLPETVPQAITLFVLDYAANAKQAKRIVRHLDEAYDKLNPRPWRDPLVTVVLETLEDEPHDEPQQPEKEN